MPIFVRATDDGQPALIDCLTLWLSNVMHAELDIDAEAASLLDAFEHARGPVVCVSNEVGLGIVPDNALARAFRDAAGRLNQIVAAQADRVDFIAAGLDAGAPFAASPNAGRAFLSSPLRHAPPALDSRALAKKEPEPSSSDTAASPSAAETYVSKRAEGERGSALDSRAFVFFSRAREL